MTARLESLFQRVESGAQKVVGRALQRFRSRASGAEPQAAAVVDAAPPHSVPSGAAPASGEPDQSAPAPASAAAAASRGSARPGPRASGAAPVREPELPVNYGRSRVVVLAIDPHHVHAYWEVTPSDAAAAHERLAVSGGSVPTWVLRFYDVTRGDVDAASAHAHFDVEIDRNARNWYIDLWASDKTYLVELGARLGSEFTTVSRANPVTLPPARGSVPEQPEWRTADPARATTHPVAPTDARLPAVPSVAAVEAAMLEGAPGLAWALPQADLAGEQPWVRASRELDAASGGTAANLEAPPSSETPPTRASTPRALSLAPASARAEAAPRAPGKASRSRSVSLPGHAAGSGGSVVAGGDSRE